MVRPDNAFLKGLSDREFQLISGDLSPVTFQRSDHAQRNEEPVEWVYFPETAVISLISYDRGARSVETSMVGCEGAAGVVEVCGSSVAAVDGVVQIDGRAQRLSRAAFRKLALGDGALLSKVWALAELQLLETRQAGLCQSAHPVHQRFGKWLLESFDRSGGRNPLPLTQEFLSAMLGVQRTTVTPLASKLQKEGLIRYRRGNLQLLDLEGLEHLSCDCRSILKGHRRRLGLAIDPQTLNRADSVKDSLSVG